MVALGKKSTSAQTPPLALKVEQVRQVLSGLQAESTPAQNPSVESEEHATYERQVSYGTKPVDLMNSKVPVALPPWQEPATCPPQLRMNCTARLTSTPRPRRAILIRSASDESAPCAQQLPQYWGRCWFRFLVTSDLPKRGKSPQLNCFGMSPGFR